MGRGEIPAPNLMQMYTDAIDRLYEIFPHILVERHKLEEDGIKRFAVIYTADVNGSEKQWLATYYSKAACLVNSTYNLHVDDDWTPKYVIDLKTGQAWNIEIKAILGSQINFE